jgi:hypothetical protein
MGNVGITGRDDDVVFYNPAQLAVVRGTTISGEQDSETIALDINRFVTGALSSAMAFGSGGIGIGGLFSRSSFNVGNVFENMTSVAAAAGAAQVFKGFRVGVAAKYQGENLVGRYESRGLADLGIARPFRQYFTGGLAVQNMVIGGTDLGGVTPTRATLGASGAGPIGPYDLFLTAALSFDDRDHRVRPAGGVEINWSWLNGYNVALRVGARDPIDGQRPLTGGLGLTVDRISIDYAVETLGQTSITHAGHRIGLRVR